MVLLAARLCLVLTLTATAGAATSCDSARTGAGGRPRASSTVVCSHQVDKPRDPGTFVLGRVYFGGYASPGWRQGAKLQASRWSDREWFSKVGLAVRGVARVVLRVSPTHERSVRMEGWSKPGSPAITLHQTARGRCPDQVWQTYFGGFVYSKRQCLRLRVEVGNRKARVPFGLGVAC